MWRRRLRRRSVGNQNRRRGGGATSFFVIIRRRSSGILLFRDRFESAAKTLGINTYDRGFFTDERSDATPNQHTRFHRASRRARRFRRFSLRPHGEPDGVGRENVA